MDKLYSSILFYDLTIEAKSNDKNVKIARPISIKEAFGLIEELPKMEQKMKIGKKLFQLSDYNKQGDEVHILVKQTNTNKPDPSLTNVKTYESRKIAKKLTRD